jgi:hypothetical protein
VSLEISAQRQREGARHKEGDRHREDDVREEHHVINRRDRSVTAEFRVHAADEYLVRDIADEEHGRHCAGAEHESAVKTDTRGALQRFGRADRSPDADEASGHQYRGQGIQRGVQCRDVLDRHGMSSRSATSAPSTTGR